MTLDKLKVSARQHEQREEWRAAIELYREAIREGEESSEATDPYLFSRIGDLEQKAGDVRAACEAWEQAVVRYGDLGFLNNAIAICAKILRLDPSRTRIHLELARHEARKGMFHDANRDLQAYLSRMHREGKDARAVEALQTLGLEFPGWAELQTALDEIIGDERNLSGKVTESGGKAAPGLVFIDTGPLALERASEPSAETRVTVGADALGVEPTVTSGLDFERQVEAIDGLEPTIPDASTAGEPTAGEVEGLLAMDRVAAELGASEPMEGLEQTLDSSPPVAVPQIEGLEPSGLESDEAPAGADGIVFLETEGSTAAAPVVPTPREIPIAADDDPLGQRAMGHSLLAVGDRIKGVAAFERALALYQQREDWVSAWQAASELVEAEPHRIGHHQTRVEIASTLNDTGKRTDAYLDLGDALRRAGNDEKAVAVFRRVLEHVPDQPRAVEALRAMRPATPTTPGNEGFIDLREMLVDDGPRTTRMRTETTPVRADEDETFREALAEFKRALDENLPIEDSQAHYDLGVAFKEMGLLDEAVGSFQKALRSPDARLRTSEALGQTFFDQGKVAVAEAVLRNAERGPEPESEKIGVLYWLGRSMESQGRHADALACYQRVLAVDVLFMDVSDRLLNVTEAGSR